METFHLNGKAHIDFELDSKVKYVTVTAPNGEVTTVRSFKTRDFTIQRDEMGFSKPVMNVYKPEYLQARYYPLTEGVHKYTAYTFDGTEVSSGEFGTQNEYDFKGYVEVSKNDKRYFSYTDGTCFVPNGISVPESKMHPTRDDYCYPHYEIHGNRFCTLGILEYERIIKKMRENEMNLLKICIGGSIFDARTGEPEVYDYGAFSALDIIIDRCRRYNIKVMLTFDIFRSFRLNRGVEDRFVATRCERGTRRRVYDAGSYMRNPTFREEWVRDIRGYVYRYGNDPTVFAFEIWDEMDRLENFSMEDVIDFTNFVVPLIKKRVPHTMVTTSISRYDAPEKLANQKALAECDLSFDQLHRCLDTRCKHPDCRGELQMMVLSGINDLTPKKKPLLFSNTGIVNAGTDQPYLYYRWDHTGIVLHDVGFSAFFGGAAGVGILNETADYIDAQNLWEHYKVFGEMVNSLKVDKQRFKFEYYRRKYYYMQVMRGRTTTLIYIRSIYENFNRTLIADQRTIVRRGIRIKCMDGDHARVYPLPGELPMPKELKEKDGEFWLPGFKHGMFLRVR